VSDHIAVADLAEADEDLLDPDRAAEVAAHVASCAECTHTVALLRHVSQVLAAEPGIAMPAPVARRLDAVIGDEQVRRETKRAQVAGTPRATLGSFEGPKRARGRVLASSLAALALAGLVGFGGYWLSAVAGLNEPPVSSVSVDSKQLGSGAAAIRRGSDLDPHRFSRAWDCARQATTGRIIGLTSATVDGAPALLVYLRTGEATTVTVVTGCSTGHPTAAASTTLR
jgi:hypothetical protein